VNVRMVPNRFVAVRAANPGVDGHTIPLDWGALYPVERADPELVVIVEPVTEQSGLHSVARTGVRRVGVPEEVRHGGFLPWWLGGLEVAEAQPPTLRPHLATRERV
jgi:hypothetical protein